MTFKFANEIRGHGLRETPERGYCVASCVNQTDREHPASPALTDMRAAIRSLDKASMELTRSALEDGDLRLQNSRLRLQIVMDETNLAELLTDAFEKGRQQGFQDATGRRGDDDRTSEHN